LFLSTTITPISFPLPGEESTISGPTQIQKRTNARKSSNNRRSLFL
jgi:hypothetical protein